jgi:hypothetical protein
MTIPITPDTQRDAKPPREGRLSPDGKWRSFPKVPNLVQYVSTATYFGRVKIEGKIFRASLQTDVFTTAKLLLGGFIKKKQKGANRAISGTFSEARTSYETNLEADHPLQARIRTEANSTGGTASRRCSEPGRNSTHNTQQKSPKPTAASGRPDSRESMMSSFSTTRSARSATF